MAVVGPVMPPMMAYVPVATPYNVMPVHCHLPAPTHQMFWQEARDEGAVAPLPTCEKAAPKSKAARRRHRDRKGATLATPPRKSSDEVLGVPRYQSAAELLELLVGAPKAAGVGLVDPKATAPSVFPTGSLSYQDGVGAAAPGPNVEELDKNSERSNELVARLENANRNEQSQLVHWLMKAAKPLSLSKNGCRVVQKALEVANCTDRDLLVAELQPSVEELYDSPHGNFVLTKIVEVLPGAAIGIVVEKFKGKGQSVARHRFGCRVMERLIEHCDESQIGGLVDEIMAEVGQLCRHPFGNFVVQHLLEHWPSKHNAICKSMIQDTPVLAAHKTASHVVQKALECCDKDCKEALVSSLLRGQGANSLVEVACSRYGSFVVEQLSVMEGHSNEVKRLIGEGSEKLSQSPFGIRVLQRLGLAADEHDKSPTEEQNDEQAERITVGDP